jgi:GNAT superfamily N-acetyltransferase
LLFRPLQHSDIPASADLMYQVWHQSYADFVPATFAHERFSLGQCIAKQEKMLHLCAEHPDDHTAIGLFERATNRLAGFIYIGASEDSNNPDFVIDGFDAELHTFYIHPDYRNKGLGQDLLEEAAHWLVEKNKTTLCLWSFIDNTRANDFYFRNGATIHKTTSYNYSETSLGLYILSWADFPAAMQGL